MTYNKKNKLKYFSLALITLIGSCSFQIPDFSEPKLPVKFFKTNPYVENEGKYVTSKGELKTLFIYVIFKDDKADESNVWQYSETELPFWATRIVNKTTVLNFPDNNLTQYFYEMSRGNFMLYGDVYPEVIVPKKNQDQYKSIAEVNYEILTSLDDKINFAQYDNWSKGEDGKYVNKADGKVDVIYIIYRNFENRLFFNNGWTGSAHLYLSENINTNDGVKITKGRLDKGSGIQVRGAKNGYTFLKYVLAHEFGHLLFGAGHIENVTNLALMTGGPVWNASRGMHSWERSRLGWINFKDIPLERNTTVLLDDYHVSGNAYRIKLSEKEWYILENHQKISDHDWARDKGVYIYHIKNADRFSPSITVKCADGNWDFSVKEDDKRLFKVSPNPLGKTEMNFRRVINKKSYSCFDQVYEDNSAWGDKFDAYDLSYNNLFSPTSNPSSVNGKKVDFSIFIKEKQGDKYLAEINFGDIYERTPPSKPQIIGVQFKKSSGYILQWLPNKEPDFEKYSLFYSYNKDKGIKKYKDLSDIGNKKQVNFSISPLLNNKSKNITIALKAIDKSGKSSVYSDFIELFYLPSGKKWAWKRIEQY